MKFLKSLLFVLSALLLLVNCRKDYAPNNTVESDRQIRALYLGDYNKGSNTAPGYPINPWFVVSVSSSLDCPTCLSFTSLSLGSMGDDQIFPVNAYVLEGKLIIPDQIYAIPYFVIPGSGHIDPYLLKINGGATQEAPEIKILLNKYVKFENDTSFQFLTTKTIYLTRI